MVPVFTTSDTPGASQSSAEGTLAGSPWTTRSLSSGFSTYLVKKKQQPRAKRERFLAAETFPRLLNRGLGKRPRVRMVPTRYRNNISSFIPFYYPSHFNQELILFLVTLNSSCFAPVQDVFPSIEGPHQPLCLRLGLASLHLGVASLSQRPGEFRASINERVCSDLGCRAWSRSRHAALHMMAPGLAAYALPVIQSWIKIKLTVTWHQIGKWVTCRPSQGERERPRSLPRLHLVSFQGTGVIRLHCCADLSENDLFPLSPTLQLPQNKCDRLLLSFLPPIV